MTLLEVVDGALAVSGGSDDGLWVEAEIGGNSFRHFDIDNGVGQRVIHVMSKRTASRMNVEIGIVVA